MLGCCWMLFGLDTCAGYPWPMQLGLQWVWPSANVNHCLCYPIDVFIDLTTWKKLHINMLHIMVSQNSSQPQSTGWASALSARQQSDAFAINLPFGRTKSLMWPQFHAGILFSASFLLIHIRSLKLWIKKRRETESDTITREPSIPYTLVFA